jgi:GNAT superfamily N-acetyltransferase
MRLVSPPTICDLVDVPRVIPRFAVLLNEQWGEGRGVSCFQVEAGIKAWCRKDDLPWGVVAIADAEPAGIAVLHSDGLRSRRDIQPWLSSLFVAARHRNRGIGATLLQAVERRTQSLGHDMLYLHTADRALFYGRLGWDAFDTDIHFGRAVVLMRKRLGR